MRIRIGDFARMSQMSVKTLRYYDRMGLLKPVEIDRFTGYRYYNEAQLKPARLVLILRRLDMPLALIQQVLAADAKAAEEIVQAYWQGIEAQVAERRRILGYVHAYLQGKEQIMTYTVNTKHVPEQPVISIRQTVSIQELVGYIDRSIRALQAHARAQGGEAAGAPQGIYHGEVNEDSNGPVEICLPVKGHIKPGKDIQVRSLAPAQVAHTTITERQAEFPAILQAYDAIYEWIKQNGHKTTEPPREIYLSAPGEAGPDEPFIEIAWPFR
ncbi:MAG: transcriptional regulator, MerR family [Anaerolineales bacterium]|nr:transcriptional regulator, MerR family [Anaerolineales bacterium]